MAGEGRTAPRSRLLLNAQLRVAGSRTAAVKIRNLSSTGALLEALRLPAKDAEIELHRGELSASGIVAWVKPGRCGVHFHSPIDLDAWIPMRILSEGQQRVDEIQAGLRAGAPIANPEASSGTLELDLATRVAEELGYISRMLEALGEDLATDIMAARHGAKLQSLDISIQTLGNLATVLRASDAEGAIRQIGMEDLRRRLLRKSL